MSAHAGTPHVQAAHMLQQSGLAAAGGSQLSGFMPSQLLLSQAASQGGGGASSAFQPVPSRAPSQPLAHDDHPPAEAARVHEVTKPQVSGHACPPCLARCS